MLIRGEKPKRNEACSALSRAYTHRVAISNRRLVALNDKAVLKWKDYRQLGWTDGQISGSTLAGLAMPGLSDNKARGADQANA
jgi:hypothetical protein